MTCYQRLYRSGALSHRVKVANRILENCTLCPRSCKVNRLKGELGFCKSGSEVIISSVGPHYGEEPFLSGSRGSGTIFFTNCNLRCLFCQNYQISQLGQGSVISIPDLAKKMLYLAEIGCHNINLVTPTHFVPQILSALLIACEKGLNLPLVYNTNGYDSIETLKLLDGIIDIYLPDIKYSDETSAKECSGTGDYVKYNQPALKEMYRQAGRPKSRRAGRRPVGNLVVNNEGIAESGLIIRHLVLPGQLAGSFKSLDFIAKELSLDTCVGLMAQYHPCYKAHQHPVLKRGITAPEYEEVANYARALDLGNALVQDLVSSDDWLPDFRKEKPFGD